MACPDCFSNSPLIFDVQSWVNASCADCIQQNCLPVKALCYTGPDLLCSGIVTGDTLEVALQKLDTQVCSALGDYSTYQFNCLTAWLGSPITTEAEFVDAITGYACEIADNLLTVTSETIPNLEAAVTAQLEEALVPGITCDAGGVTDTDNVNQILAKYCTVLTNLSAAVDISSVVWTICFASSTPANIGEAFTLVEQQICLVKEIADAAAVLPIFDNTGNCLTGGATDTLVQTINALTDYTCNILDITNIGWGCMSDPSATNFSGVINTISSNISALYVFSIRSITADFTLTAINPEDPCNGLQLALATPLVNSDRLVASNVSDTSPGTLIEKLTAGTNITLDDISTPGQVIINASDDHLLLAGPGDLTPGLLVDKVLGSTDNGITLNPTYNAINEQVDLTITADLAVLGANLLTYIAASPTLLAQFCAIVATCNAGCETTLYSIENTSGDTQSIFWLACGSPSYLNVNMETGTTIELCAITDSIIPIVGVTVTDLGPCPTVEPPTTTTTTTAAP